MNELYEQSDLFPPPLLLPSALSADVRAGVVKFTCGNHTRAIRRVRVVCFHYAGGSASTYGDWERRLSEKLGTACKIEIIAIVARTRQTASHKTCGIREAGY